MPVSEQQLAANRANAQLSRGPVSIAGKKRSSQNALRHGVTAQTTIMTEEDRIKHDDFCSQMMADLAPAGSIETFLASSVAEDAWRLNYTRAQCANIVAIGHFDGTADRFDAEHPEIHTAITAASTVRDNAKTLELLSLYEQRIHRTFEKNFSHLKQLQAERQAKRDQDLDKARQFFQLAELMHLPYNPSADGFIFSTTEIAAFTERFHRFELASQSNWQYRERISGYDKLPKAA